MELYMFSNTTLYPAISRPSNVNFITGLLGCIVLANKTFLMGSIVNPFNPWAGNDPNISTSSEAEVSGTGGKTDVHISAFEDRCSFPNK